MGKNNKHQRLRINIPSLPSDIVYEVLANLPVKTLLRFRSVCKSWNSIISDPQFQLEHHRRSSGQNLLLLIAHTDSYEVTRPDFLEISRHDTNEGTLINQFCLTLLPYNCRIGTMQSCQGLVCLAFSSQIFIFNPSTRGVTILPYTQGYNHRVGFGYVASTNEIKVVRIFSTIRRQITCPINAQMFTLGTREWVQARSPPLDFFCFDTTRAPFLHGAIHFLSDTLNQNEYDALYAFDIQSEEYRTIQLPENYYALKAESFVWSRICLNELRGSLCLTFNLADAMELWILKDYPAGEWVQEYIVYPMPSTEFDWGEPLAIMANGTLLLNIFEIDKVSGQLYWYNPRDGIFINNSEGNGTATTYVESLLTPEEQSVTIWHR